MKTLLILSALIGFTLPEKLDRTYLPPPGSKFSGGSPGAIDVPLELPKKTYTPSSLDNNFGRPDIAIGINRVGSNISPEKYGDIISTVPSFQENSYGFPTTTTSNALLQTTSYVPAADSTIEPDVSLNNSINITSPNYLREKNLSFHNTEPKEKQKLNDINDILENQLPHNRFSSQVVKNISDEQHFNNGGLDSIPKINSYSGNLFVGIPAVTSNPAEIDHSLLSNNYDIYHNPPSSEPMGQHEANLSFSIPMSPDNTYSITPSKHVSTAPISKTNTPFSYHARPEGIQAQDREAVILNYDNTITPDGFAYSFDTSNGIHADEKGIAINGVQAVGSYSYIGDDGLLYSVNYTADENGFRPYGAHLPTAPPIPDAILKVIEQAAADKANGIYDDGSYDENKYGYKKYNPSKSTGFLRKYNKNREGSNLNRSKSNNKFLHKTRLADKLNKDNDTDREYEQNYVTENLQQPYIKKEFVNGSVSEFSPNDKSEHFENKEKDSSNNVYNNNLHNKILSSVPHLKDIEKEDKIMSIELYDEKGYHYSKPQNDYSLETASKLLNRFPETPALIEIPAKYKKIVDYVPTSPFKSPYYVLQDNDIFVGNDGDDQSLNIPTKYHEEQNDILNNPKTMPFVTLKETKLAPGSTENIKHDFTNQFEQPGISPSDQGYLYSKNGNSDNDSNVPFISSTEIGLSDITSTTPTAFPSRSNSMESRKDSRLSKLSDLSLFQNQAPFSNPLLDQEKYPGTLTHSIRLDNYGINDDDDIIDSGSRYGTPSMYGVKDYIMEHSTPKTYGEDFGGPKQAQKFDPLTGYYY